MAQAINVGIVGIIATGAQDQKIPTICVVA